MRGKRVRLRCQRCGNAFWAVGKGARRSHLCTGCEQLRRLVMTSKALAHGDEELVEEELTDEVRVV